jgi:hypothetical protein
MNNVLAGGAIGALTTNLLHETVRRTIPNAPRVDLLGMQALAKLISGKTEPPTGKALYASALAGDLLSNSLYFSLIGRFPREHTVKAGALVGALAGIGAVVLPGRMGLSEELTTRTNTTKALTIALYTAGGIATGMALRSHDSDVTARAHELEHDDGKDRRNDEGSHAADPITEE